MEEGIKFKSPEEEIQYLERKILEKRKELGGEESRHAVTEVLKEHAAQVPSSPSSDLSPGSDAKTSTPPDQQQYIDFLVQFAFQNGVADAVKKARETHNPHIIDAFHDAMTDRFVDALKAKGLLDTHG